MKTDSLVPKAALVLGAICAAAVFVTAVLYRTQKPSLEMRVAPATSPQAQGGMGQVGEMMVALEKDPTNTELLGALAVQFMDARDFERAAVFWKRIIAADPNDVNAYYFLGISLFQTGAYQEAAEQFETVVRMRPDDYRSLFNLGVLYTHFLDQPEKGRAAFEKVLSLKPDDPDVLKKAREELGR